MDKIRLTEQEWRRKLTPAQYDITSGQGTEPALTGKYWNNHDEGTYRCVACGLVLFSSKSKFASGTGWPSFSQPIAPDHVETAMDRSHGMVRIEARCTRCGSHLGHVFED